MLDENGKINLNLADAALLTAFLKALGEDDAQARQLAGAIIDWRDEDSLLQPGGGAEAPDYAAAGLPYGPRNKRFETLGELQRVLGMRGPVPGDAAAPDPLQPPGTAGSAVRQRAGADRAGPGCGQCDGAARTAGA